MDRRVWQCMDQLTASPKETLDMIGTIVAINKTWSAGTWAVRGARLSVIFMLSPPQTHRMTCMVDT